MKRFISLFTTSALIVAGFSVTGCASNDSKQSVNNQGSTAGGNGAFGESPSRPGSYAGDKYNNPTTQPDIAK